MKALLDVRLWLAFDIDDDGRVLAGHDDLGSLQLVEIAPDGSTTALTDLPSRCSGRYLPGRRQVFVQHDSGGDEQWQISLLDLAGPGTHAVIRNRCYGGDPAEVAVIGRAVADGLMAGGVLPVAKHMPGQGRAGLDSHTALPRVEASRAELAADFAPFRALAGPAAES